MTDNTDPQATGETGDSSPVSGAHSDFGNFPDPILTLAQNESGQNGCPRPDLEEIDELIYAYEATGSPMPAGSVIFYLAHLAAYTLRLESQLAELRHSNAALLAANVEETARADKWHKEQKRTLNAMYTELTEWFNFLDFGQVGACYACSQEFAKSMHDHFAIEADRDQWKARAEAAEQRFRELGKT